MDFTHIDSSTDPLHHGGKCLILELLGILYDDLKNQEYPPTLDFINYIFFLAFMSIMLQTFLAKIVLEFISTS